MTRLDNYEVAPEGVKAVNGLEQYLRTSGLERSLLELVKLRRLSDQRVRATIAVIAINAWNRLAVTFRPAVGTCKSTLVGRPA